MVATAEGLDITEIIATRPVSRSHRRQQEPVDCLVQLRAPAVGCMPAPPGWRAAPSASACTTRPAAWPGPGRRLVRRRRSAGMCHHQRESGTRFLPESRKSAPAAAWMSRCRQLSGSRAARSKVCQEKVVSMPEPLDIRRKPWSGEWIFARVRIAGAARRRRRARRAGGHPCPGQPANPSISGGRSARTGTGWRTWCSFAMALPPFW